MKAERSSAEVVGWPGTGRRAGRPKEARRVAVELRDKVEVSAAAEGPAVGPIPAGVIPVARTRAEWMREVPMQAEWTRAAPTRVGATRAAAVRAWVALPLAAQARQVAATRRAAR